MKSYQCNVCGKFYDLFNEAALCHPDVNVIDEAEAVELDSDYAVVIANADNPVEEEAKG